MYLYGGVEFYESVEEPESAYNLEWYQYSLYNKLMYLQWP